MTAPLLEPCPFCGSTDLEISNVPRLIYFVECNTCQTLGPNGISFDAAIAAWNRRAPVAVNAELLAALQGIIDTCPCDPDINNNWLTAWETAKAAIATAPVAVNADLLATLKLVRMYCPVHVQDGIDKLTARAEGRQP